ncbi:inosine/xanthosine triphosphatase [Candidatus Hodarchaeum mangrovi]
MSIKVQVASKNPIKIQAAKEAFETFFHDVKITPIDVTTLNSPNNYLNQVQWTNQPIGELETFEYSQRRVQLIRDYNPEFDYYVGLEGGISQTRFGTHRIIVFCTVADPVYIETVRGCEIPLPSHWYEALVDDPFLELGTIVDKASGIENIKQKQGAIGFFTDNKINRKDILKETLIMCLIPFRNRTLFQFSSDKKEKKCH